MFSNEQGLSYEEIKKRQEIYGLNLLPEKPPPSKLFIILQQLKSPLVYILLIAAFITIAIGHYSDAVIIFIAVFINTILGYIQENRASSALHALKHYVTAQATVIREGKRELIDTTQLVPGDTVILSQGQKIPADGKLLFANRLYIDEAILTGESIPVNKNNDDEVLMGTTISSGQGLMVVERIGASTTMGTIAKKIQDTKGDTPLQKQLKYFSRQLVILIVFLVTGVFILGISYNFSLVEIFSTSIALMVSSIPEGLLVALTVVLAIGMQKILKRRGLVRNLSAAETLGGVTIICVDKTGTLTQGKMEVVEYIGDKNLLAQQVLLANDLDDPIVIAAFEWGRTIITDFISEHQRLDSIPFSPEERVFISLHEWTSKNNIMFVNGAPELLLELSNLSENEKQEISINIDNLTKQGKRLIGYARKLVPLNKKTIEISDTKEGLEWVGIIAFTDPVRPGVKEAINEAMTAGIRIAVITGDYAKTSQFVLKELGIEVNEEEIITGNQLVDMSDEEISKRVKTVKLFARTTPNQKLAVVEALKKNGEIVAMMGDGVNDAPALHKADIGIVVGDATDVAKESADLVLLDSNFATIVAAIEEGRVIFENIRKIILYLVGGAFSGIVIVMGSIALGFPLPISPVQILWINLVSDGFPHLSLTIDPKRIEVMFEPPRSPKQKLVNSQIISFIGIISLVIGFVCLGVFIIINKMTGDLTIARSMTFITLGMSTLTYAFSARILTKPFWKSHLFENKWLILAVAGGVLLQIFPFTIPSLRQFFGLHPLGASYWIIAILLSISIFFFIEICKVIYNIRFVRRLFDSETYLN
ncbi:MAG: calcium-translocating P-type ATPase, PMCA-type [Patescibacteria group bacterium]|nr:MAG: calcium-translocating P-type ATPase, PMCA-type [Patescibacteria group bacterium]